MNYTNTLLLNVTVYIENVINKIMGLVDSILREIENEKQQI